MPLLLSSLCPLPLLGHSHRLLPGAPLPTSQRAGVENDSAKPGKVWTPCPSGFLANTQQDLSQFLEHCRSARTRMSSPGQLSWSLQTIL